MRDKTAWDECTPFWYKEKDQIVEFSCTTQKYPKTIMREFHFKLPAGKKAPYLRIAGAIREAIRQGQLRSGESLPSSRSLSASIGVHRHTIMTALDELVAEGWLQAVPRSAYRVSETLPEAYFEAERPRSPAKRARSHSWSIARDIALPPVNEVEKMRYNFRSGIPDLRLFPHLEFKACLSEAIRRSGPRLMEYGAVEGHPPFVRELKTYLRRMRALTDREVIVTHGSQEAIFLIGQLLLNTGDQVAVEALGYPPAFAALRAAGAELLPIRVDAEGLNTDDLERVLRNQQGRVKLIYVTPLHQYPTTVTLPMARRLRLYELACRYGVPILEDDYDHEYHYRCNPLAPLASEDPEGRILYVSTFSKVFSPAARLGFMAVPAALAPKLSNLKRLVSRQNELLTQDALARWMRSGGFERHLRRTRRHYEARRDVLAACLEKARSQGADLCWQLPDGGMAIWVETGLNAERVAESARAQGIYISHAAEFSLGPPKPNGFRLAFARQTPAEIRQGMDLLLGHL
jgi:GntR family transcriptional regulator / MocR family aminotransferase